MNTNVFVGRAMRASFISVLIALSACGQDVGGIQARLGSSAGCGEVQADDGPGTGSAGAHGQAQRTDGDVQISHDGADVVARQTVSIANDFGGAANGDVTLTTGNGNVVSCTRGNGGYRTNVHLEGRGATEDEARAALASMSVTHSDMLTAGTLRLSTTVQFNDSGNSGGNCTISVPPIITCNSGGGSDLKRSASIVAGLPSSPSYAFDHSTGNGEVVATGFSGSSAQLSTGNGDVGLDGSWSQSALDSGNGNVAARLQTLRSGSHEITTGNGNIDVALAISGTPGFDLTASTGNGSATIDVAGTDAVGEQTSNSAHRQSPSYSTSAVKISVDAHSGNQDVAIHD